MVLFVGRTEEARTSVVDMFTEIFFKKRIL